MPFRRFIAALLILFPGLCFSTTEPIAQAEHMLTARENRVWARDTEFASIGHTTHNACQATHAPEALATPSPLLGSSEENTKIKVTFIVGTDGRVHSPFIMESAGTSEDQVVLDAVRTWRFRPATCNGVPTEAEAKIGFSIR